MPDSQDRPTGLSFSEAERRLATNGANEIAHRATSSPWGMLLTQFMSPVIWLLLGAAIVSGFLGELVDAIAIGAIVALNGVVGFVQEYRADRAILALRALTAPRARVRRDDRSIVVPAREVVVGDLLLLEPGDVVAADGRLLEAHALTAVEASLTGESLPSEKSARAGSETLTLAERRNWVFMGTSIAGGSGLATVVATGMQTELGKVATLIATAEEGETPLQKRLASMSRVLLYASTAIVLLVAALGLARGLGAFSVFRSAVSLAVAAVPEGLPAIVTLALALGVRRMVGRHVLVRRLSAVETLGCATVICTDKTGTLTAGVMTVREVWGPDHVALLDAAAACCEAELASDGQGGVGDPTEIAILASAANIGIQRSHIELERPRRHVAPFDSDRKRMSILRSDGILYVKGSVESILARATLGLDGIARANAHMAARGLRVLAVATGGGLDEKELRILGLLGLADPPRPEVRTAIAAAHEAGIAVVMITGDHPLTARAIAAELGISGPNEPAAGLVHARATPEDKLKIVREWKAHGAVVAMTGDGVNDAPALREAHIGICMGRTGTEVTREAAGMILTDDDFTSIVAAVREGRGIFDNIRKALVFLLSGNMGELVLMLAASIAGLPLPLLPLHLLWINLVTDGFPALALVNEPVDADVMRRPPRPTNEAILRRSDWGLMILAGCLEAAVALGVFLWALEHRDLPTARSLAFSVIALAEVFWALGPRITALARGGALFDNRLLLGAVAGTALIQVVLHYIPATRALFQLVPLSLADLALTLLLSLLPLAIISGVQLGLSRRDRVESVG